MRVSTAPPQGTVRRALAPLTRRVDRVSARARLRLHHMSEWQLFVLVAIPTSLGGLWSFLDYSRHVRVASVIVISLVVGALILTTWSVLALMVLLAFWTFLVVWLHSSAGSQLTGSGFVMWAFVAVAAIVQARRRDALGLRRRSAGSVLEQMRDRISVQASLPTLPAGWRADVAQRSAGGAAIAGDFVSARLLPGRGDGFLELVVVDVSGSGFDAGPRALLLSGAIGGLLGSVAPDRLLTETNDYVRRQGWDSGFATAAYLRIDLDSFAYELRSAGHPPAVVWNGLSRTISRSTAAGTVLGVLEQLDVTPEIGRLAPGDALVLYTDGVVETRRMALDDGIDSLAYSIDARLRRSGPERLADGLVDGSGDRADVDDDRTVVVLWNNRGPRDEPVDVDPLSTLVTAESSAAPVAPSVIGGGSAPQALS